MALAIRTIPTLSGEDAINFEEKANKVEDNPHTIDCSKDIEIVRQYLNSESPSKQGLSWLYMSLCSVTCHAILFMPTAVAEELTCIGQHHSP